MKKIIILYFLGALLLSGCMRDEFDTTRVEEGIAARVSLRVLLPDMDGAVSAAIPAPLPTPALSMPRWRSLDSLRVLVFTARQDSNQPQIHGTVRRIAFVSPDRHLVGQ